MHGVPTTIASFWAVEDESTSILMTEFYEQLLQGKSKARALQLAMLKTKETYPDPGYWAPFALFGQAN